MRISEIKKLLKEWQIRKSWNSDFTGPHTTNEEDKLALALQTLLNKYENAKDFKRRVS
jgi:hypothetical protein